MTADAPPNVLIVIADDVGVDKISSYAVDYGDYARRAQALPDTPTVDTLAAVGLRFSDAWATPVCSPTRAGVLTGRTAFRTGVGATIPNGQDLDLDHETTLADLLTDPTAGPVAYTAGMFGKWHLGVTGAAGTRDWGLDGATHRNVLDTAPPLRAGFSEYRGPLDGHPEDYYGWTRVMDGPYGPASVDAIDRYAPDVEADDTVDWIHEQPGPWFALLAFSASHADGDEETYEPDDTGPRCTMSTCLADGTCASAEQTAFADLTTCMDHGLDTVLSGLDEDTLANTVIVFLGDNGTVRDEMEGKFSETGSRTDNGKGSVYESGLRVPLVVADGTNVLEWRACTEAQRTSGTCPLTERLLVDPGRVVTTPVSTMDLYATLADLTGFTQTTATDSVSFYDCFGDPSETCAPRGDRPVYSEMFDYSGTADGGPDTTILSAGQAALRIGPAKLVVRLDSDAHCFTRELYDLDADRFELTNLVADPAYTATLDELTDALTTLDPPWITSRGFCP